MLKIQRYLTSELSKISPRVYFKDSKSDSIFPYVVFNLPNSTNPETDSENVVLEINIWDYSRESYDASRNVEVIADRIEEALSFNRYLRDDCLLIFTKRNRLTLRDSDKNVERRQLRYRIKYYNK